MERFPKEYPFLEYLDDPGFDPEWTMLDRKSFVDLNPLVTGGHDPILSDGQ